MHNTNEWGISSEDPILYLRICPSAEDYQFQKYNIPAGDKFGAEQANTVREIVASVIADVNSVATSYLSIELIGELFLISQ